MARDVIIHQINDWSVLNSRVEGWSKVDLSTPELNFGIHSISAKIMLLTVLAVVMSVLEGFMTRMDAIYNHPAKNTLL